MKKVEIVWHKYPDEKPPEEDDYLVTVQVGLKPFIHYLHYSSYTTGRGSQWGYVTAWMDKPKPYKEEESI